LDHTVHGQLKSAKSPFNNAYSRGEAKLLIIVSDHYRSVCRSSDTTWRIRGSEKDERRGLDIVLALTNPEEAFK